MSNYITDQTFERVFELSAIEYENCNFNNCDFSATTFANINFIDCVFINCNLSLVPLHNTAFRSVSFKECKMLGLHFDHCNGFGLTFSFDGCQLNHSLFYKTKIKRTQFRNSQLQETDFTETDLGGSLFENCDLSNAVFDQTILEKVDLRTSHNFTIDPEKNRIKKAKFSLSGLPGLLHQYNIEIEN